MGAIFGILRFDGAAASQDDMRRMERVLAPFGPDDSNVMLSGPVGLGHSLLRVNREDSFESQPLCQRDADIALVADLRLDNRDALAATFGLAAAELREMPDSALLMRAYEKWGEDCAGHLLGDFVFAIWDGRARRLLLGRDHMGQRYVHCHQGAGLFIFATEIKALFAHPDVPRVLTEVGIGRMLLKDFGPREGATPFEGIIGLPAGRTLTVQADGRRRERSYWEPAADAAHQGRDEAYYVAAYRSVLGEAVACRLRRLADAPGIVFSGGYDSAALAGLAGDALRGSRRRLVAAASVMPADYRGTIRHARPWVELCARDMPWLDVRMVTRAGSDVLTDLERRLIERETPRGSYGFVQDALFSVLAGAGVRLVMDGHGGDYTLNPRGQAALARFLATGQLLRFLRELSARRRLTGFPLWSILKSEVAAMLAPQWLMTAWATLTHGTQPAWSDHPIAAGFAASLTAGAGVDRQGFRALRQIAMRDRLQGVVTLTTSAPSPGGAPEAGAHGLLLTRPFHDKRVVELALAIPEDLYVKDGWNRHLARAALKDVYPSEFQTRWRKNDDQVPDFLMMTKSIEPRLLAEIARMERSEMLRRYFDFTRMRTLLLARAPDDHNSGWEQENQLAIMGFLAARYVDWFRRSNR